MQLNLLSCDAPRPDRRAITKMLEDMASLDSSLARELTGILLDGSPIEIEVAQKNISSAYRSLRKLGIDYEIME